MPPTMCGGVVPHTTSHAGVHVPALALLWPPWPQVKQPLFHERLKRELEVVEGYDLDGAVAFTEVRPHFRVWGWLGLEVEAPTPKSGLHRGASTAAQGARATR